MRLRLRKRPRAFDGGGVTIKDFGKLQLKENEMISIMSKNSRKYDITAKEWGFYIAPSLNSRMRKYGFKVALILNESNKLFINAVEKDKIAKFKKYLKAGRNGKIICWLDELAAEEKAK